MMRNGFTDHEIRQWNLLNGMNHYAKGGRVWTPDKFKVRGTEGHLEPIRGSELGDIDDGRVFGLRMESSAPSRRPAEMRDLVTQALEHHINLPIGSEARRRSGVEAARYIASRLGTIQDGGQARPLLSANTKLKKAAKAGGDDSPIVDWHGHPIETTGLSLSPALHYRGVQTCSLGQPCYKTCLGKESGGNFNVGGGSDYHAMIGPRWDGLARTKALIDDPSQFAIRLYDEIMAKKFLAWQRGQSKLPSGRGPEFDQEMQRKFDRWADKDPTTRGKGGRLGLRLNVLSDIDPRMWQALMEGHPDAHFYDYTKIPNYQIVAPNHHLTFSSTGASQEGVHNPYANWRLARQMIRRGINVAMPFSHKAERDEPNLPHWLVDRETGERHSVVNGDTHDFRPLDDQNRNPDGSRNTGPVRPGVIVGLTKKSATHKNADAHITSRGFFVKFDPRFEKRNGEFVRQGAAKPGKRPPRVQTNFEAEIPVQPTQGYGR